MEQVKKHRLLFTLIFLLGMGTVGASEVSINHTARTVDWTDGTEAWQYFLSSGNWAWDNGSNAWTYTASTKSWKDDLADDYWLYDETNDVWLSSTDGTADVTTADAFAHQAWRYVSDAGRWHSVSRTEGDSVSFTPISHAYWEFNASNKRWTFTRVPSPDSGGRTYTNVIKNQEWSFATDATLRWEQQSPSAGKQWDYNRVNGTWINVTPDPDEVWTFYHTKNDMSAWQIVGETFEQGTSVRKEWQYPFANGSWQSREYTAADGEQAPRQYAYNSTEYKWYNDIASGPDGIPDAEDGGNPGRQIFPHLPPTPFATHKEIIEDVINTFLNDGPTIGSTDGTGEGFVDATDHAYLTDQTFVFRDITKLNLVDIVTIDGDVEFHAMEDAAITIKLRDNTNTDVKIQPAAGVDHAQLIFNVDAGKTLDIWIKDDVSFKSLDAIPLFLSFRGKGMTRFRLRSGKTLSFIPTDAVDGDEGVRIQVLMDQTAADITANKHQLVFAPWSYAVETGDNAVNTNLDLTSLIVLGRHGHISYVSPNEAGVNEDTLPGYGSIAFDVAHQGVGRMVLRMMRGDALADQSDAGFNLYGTLITGSGVGGAIENVDFRTGVTKNKLSGIRAILKITDDLARATIMPDSSNVTSEQATTWVARGATDRRGLAVVNHCGTYPHLLANLRGDTTLQTSDWAQHTGNYYPGFILGKNGQIDIWHNLFLDYIGGSINQAVNPEDLAGGAKTTADVKLRNPSAFIIDGLGEYSASADVATWDMNYAGTVDPLIILRGTAGIFARCGAKKDTGAIAEVDIIEEADGGNGPDTLNATIGAGVYNGVFAPTAHASGVYSASESIAINAQGDPVLESDGSPLCLDGEHAIICEGPVTIKSIMGPFGEAPNGYINIPSLRLDHTGKEIVS